MSVKPVIRNHHDILALPGYQASVDPRVKQLLRVVTNYYLPTEFPCGLKSCHQPHKEGYVVALENGEVTNVGWKCGEQFGARFELERRRYQEQELRPKALAIVQAAVQRVKNERSALQRLEESAARLSQLKQGLRARLPRLYGDLERKAFSGNARVVEHVQRAAGEIDDLVAATPGANREMFRYKEEDRGYLPGLSILATNIQQEVVSRLTAKAEEMLMTDFHSLATDKLLVWESWSLGFDETLVAATRLIEAGDSFFTKECFALLGYVVTVPAEKTALSKLSVASLINSNDAARPPAAGAEQAAFPSSKKERDRQKRLAAILRRSR